jgi:hypothetical protein
VWKYIIFFQVEGKFPRAPGWVSRPISIKLPTLKRKIFSFFLLCPLANLFSFYLKDTNSLYDYGKDFEHN